MTFQGSVTDTDGIDHFRIVGGDRLMWSSPETTWAARPQRFAQRHPAPHRHDFSAARESGDRGTSSAARSAGPCMACRRSGNCAKGLWVASGFGRQGLNTTAMAGQLIARSILWGDERWRLFSPFELVWAGGRTGRIVGQAVRTVGARKLGRRRRAGALPRRRARAGEHPRGAPCGSQPPGRHQAAAQTSAARGRDHRRGPFRCPGRGRRRGLFRCRGRGPRGPFRCRGRRPLTRRSDTVVVAANGPAIAGPMAGTTWEGQSSQRSPRLLDAPPTAVSVPSEVFEEKRLLPNVATVPVAPLALNATSLLESLTEKLLSMPVVL